MTDKIITVEGQIFLVVLLFLVAFISFFVGGEVGYRIGIRRNKEKHDNTFDFEKHKPFNP